MSSFAAIPILGYSILALIFSYIVQRLIRIVNFGSLLTRSSSAASSSSSSSLETLPTSNAVPSENRKSRIPLPSWDLTPFKRTTTNAYRKASALVLPSRDSVELLPTHVASPPPTAALVDYGVYTEKSTTSPPPPLPFPAPASTPPLTSSPTPSLTSTTSPRTPSPAHHSPFSIPLRVPLPTPFSLFPSPYVPLQPQPPQNVISTTRPRTPSPQSHHPLATTPPPTSAHRRSKSLGGVPVRKVANSRLGLGLGLAFPHNASAAVFPHAEVEMRDLYPTLKDKGRDVPLIDFSSSSEGEEEEEDGGGRGGGGDDEDVGVFGRKSGRGAGDSLVPGGPLEMVAMSLVDLSDTRGAGEDVFGFKNGVVMMSHGRRSIIGGGGGGDVELLSQHKRGVELLPPNRNAAEPDNTLIDIDVTSTGEEKLVDVDASSSSKTISPIEPVVLSAVPSRVVSREASPIPVVQTPPPVEPLVHLPVVQMQKNLKASVHAPVEVFAPVSVSVLDKALAVAAAESVAMPVMAAVESREEEEGGELVHVAYEDAVVVLRGEKGDEAAHEEEEEDEEEEGVLVDVSPRPVDGEVSLPAVVDVEVSRPVDVEASALEVVDGVSFPKTMDVLVDVSAEPKPAEDQDTDSTSERKPTAWKWDEEDDMMRAWSLGLDLAEAPSLPLDVVDSDVQVVGSQSLPDEKPQHDLLLTQQDPNEPSPTTTTTTTTTSSVENSPPLPLLPPLTIPLITISSTKRSQEEYPDPELLPLPDFSSTKEGRSPPSQTPTPPDSPPPPSSSSSPGGLGTVKSRTAPSSPRSPSLRPAWSLRAADAPPLGLSSSPSSGSLSATPVGSPSLMKKGGVVLKEEEGEVKVQEEEETDNKIKLSEALPGSFPDSQAPSSESSSSNTTTPATASIKALTTPDTRRIRVSRSPLDIALAMQLRPGLGVGADPAWMVRSLMAMFGWFAILVSGQGEF
ncbi:hypothetical protein K443DRAFT_436159 [Laccaria amethystina LaAM-08-1]|uniref:Uncharacterized protein n=1 Tax=Laccaria amethystina LaAM-08-1 TaxID=1095629 RepID=A0A0C9X7W2_9AGAR|nr:hypothetical protein K443DRAFT_436159 [Laccaria amethystina LaAM-08-1]